MSGNKGNKLFFHIPFACDLMQKSPTQVLAECSAFDAELATDDELHDYRVHGQFDAMVHFFCDFRLRDYQAFSTVTISFVENKAVECVLCFNGSRTASFRKICDNSSRGRYN